ncbi:hypothetical protein FNV43_RR20751 [Rhamnella rubrinervis]|uniref:Uncharacterized protein n=1 Tax=Rhamnella rubrinervis TaxID=2594499 RepID=A0A8K0GXA6_9ROSA|nr:hypothetical protein FNV43_RR20751 [Rhamnella rubrinervis]
MVSIRLTSFVFLLLLLHARHSIALTHQEPIMDDKNGGGLAVVAGVSPSNFEKEIYNGVPAMADNDVGKPRIGGRKMRLKRLMGMVEEEGIEGRDSKTSGEPVVNGKSHRMNKGISEIESKVRHTSSSTRGRGLKVKMSGFIAFNADYHVPKPHPPKNN